MEKENLEKEKSVLMGTASNQDNQDGALEITVSGEKYRCLRFAKAKKWGITGGKALEGKTDWMLFSPAIAILLFNKRYSF